MLDFKNVTVAQERYADMRRNAAHESCNRELMGSARLGLMQRVSALVTGMKRGIVRPAAEAKPLGGAMPGELA